MRALLAGLLLGTVVACSGEPGTSTVAGPDAGTATDGGAPEARADAGAQDAGAGSTDAGAPTKATSAVVTLNDVARTLERAQFGTTTKDDTFYVEAHEGGVMQCPEEETPKRTMIVSGVPKGAAGSTFTMADGVTVSVLDFEGDQIATNPPLAKATAATVTLVGSEDEGWVELEVSAAFDEGTATGRVYATYCAAMSE